MSRTITLVTAIVVTCASSTTFAAAMTDVATAFDQSEGNGVRTKNTFDLNLRAWFDTTFSGGTIQREPVTQSMVNKGCTAGAVRGCTPVDEVKWRSQTYWLKLEAEFGLWKDLSLTLSTSYAISQQYSYTYADGQSPQTSSVDNTNGPQRQAYFDLAQNQKTQTRQHGWGSLDFVLHYAITNEARDDVLPTWVVGFGLSTPWISSTYRPTPTAQSADQKSSTDPSHPQGVGDGLYRLLFSTAFSKRMLVHSLENNTPKHDIIGYIDPYLSLNYALPIPSAKAVDEFRVGPFKHNAPHVFELRTGVEWVPYHDTLAHRRFALQVGGLARYYTSGNTYSIITPALGDITFAQQYVDLGGQLALNIQVSGFVHASVGTQITYTTGHFLTGRPQSRGGQANPYYCGNSTTDECSAPTSAQLGTYDAPGTRFKDAGHITANFYGNVAFTF